ncbi:hypothetical protein OVN20_01195 [Microcella daejeonensis]|nr:hypothetical protein [Microcella daejeonensis]WAB84220.1 hypothetical protein OVN20_01195 [Microcella daejeonensis]
MDLEVEVGAGGGAGAADLADELARLDLLTDDEGDEPQIMWAYSEVTRCPLMMWSTKTWLP